MKHPIRSHGIDDQQSGPISSTPWRSTAPESVPASPMARTSCRSSRPIRPPKRIDKENTLPIMNRTDDEYRLDGNLFVWNRDKAERNWRKHGVRFQEAATVFGDPYLVLTDA